jgi:transcriptional regulator GlxA family with amidase domain
LRQSTHGTAVHRLLSPEQESIVPRRHAAMMVRFLDAAEERRGEAFCVSELCAAVGIPHRTLRHCFYKYLGVGPKRYLHLLRLHLARTALLDADTDLTSVTDVATQFGFWELGRFSGSYKALFGESPNQNRQRIFTSVRTERLVWILPPDTPPPGSMVVKLPAR